MSELEDTSTESTRTESLAEYKHQWYLANRDRTLREQREKRKNMTVEERAAQKKRRTERYLLSKDANNKRDRDRYHNNPARRAAADARCAARKKLPHVIKQDQLRNFLKHLSFVSADELERLRNNPNSNYNVCRICGAEAGHINSTHLSKHRDLLDFKNQGKLPEAFPLNVSEEELKIASHATYKRYFGFSKRIPTTSKEVSAKQRANLERRGVGEFAAKGWAGIAKKWLATQKERRPRRRKEVQETEWFGVGTKVEQKITGKRTRAAVIAARQAVSMETHLEYTTVVGYHKEYLDWLGQQPNAKQG